MLIEINEENINSINNPDFRAYAETYLEIARDFKNQVEDQGLKFDTNTHGEEIKQLRQSLKTKGASFINNDSSICAGNISSACQACCKGTGSATFFISLMCHRHCYYCFNPNQEGYAEHSQHKMDVLGELQKTMERQPHLTHLALTGGEPLLHLQDTFEFFHFIHKNLPGVHTRLYTSGDLLKIKHLEELAAAGLQEIRFSIKPEDSPEVREKVLRNMELAKSYIPEVMVEMPVIPGLDEEMKSLLHELDRMGIFGINLLEFGFPLANVDEFQKRGFVLRNPPFQVLYDYWYSGGLAISGSELLCLQLVDYAIDNGLSLGVHYCSLQNKHMGQVYQQNTTIASPKGRMYFSPRDYFLKAAKVFGDDIPKVEKVFRQKGVSQYWVNGEEGYLEFHPKEIRHLKNLPLELGISYNIMESRNGAPYIRELRIDLGRPKGFRFDDL